MDATRLRAVPLFAGLSADEIALVAKLVYEVEVPPGARLVHEGENAYEFFVIEDGYAEVVHGGDVLAELEPGDFFGELGVMSLGTRSADVVATSRLMAIVMTDWSFKKILRELPSVAEQIRSAIEERAREYVSR